MHYQLHGFNVRSSLDLPCSRGDFEQPDLVVELGKVKDHLDNPVAVGVCYEARAGEFLLKLPGVGKCLVTRGAEITLEPEGEIEPLYPYLLGSCIAALAHQRGIVALHAASVTKDGLTILFLGPSGAGKSTLSAAFAQRGWTVLSDDLTVVHPSDTGKGRIFVGPRRIRLDQRSSLALGFSDFAPTSAFEGKAEIPVPGSSASVTIDKIFLIGPWNRPEFIMRRQSNLDTVKALVVHTFRTRYLKGLNSRPEHLKQITSFSSSIELWGIKRPGFDFRLNELIELIEKTL